MSDSLYKPLPLVVGLLLAVVTACNPLTVETRADWWLAGPGEGRELSLVVYTNGSSCTHYSHVEVHESEDSVEVRAFDQVKRMMGCTDDYTTHLTDITLDSPLADRQLTGCVAPPDGLRARDLDHGEADCRSRTPDLENS